MRYIIRTYRSILHLDLELGVLLAHDGQLDADVATFVTSQQTLLEKYISKFVSNHININLHYLIYQWKSGAIRSTSLDHHD